MRIDRSISVTTLEDSIVKGLCSEGSICHVSVVHERAVEINSHHTPRESGVSLSALLIELSMDFGFNSARSHDERIRFANDDAAQVLALVGLANDGLERFGRDSLVLRPGLIAVAKKLRRAFDVMLFDGGP